MSSITAQVPLSLSDSVNIDMKGACRLLNGKHKIRVCEIQGDTSRENFSMYYVNSGFINSYGLLYLPGEVTYVILYIFSLPFKIINHDLCVHTQVIVTRRYTVKILY